MRSLFQKTIFGESRSVLFQKDDILHIFLRPKRRIDDSARHEEERRRMVIKAVQKRIVPGNGEYPALAEPLSAALKLRLEE